MSVSDTSTPKGADMPTLEEVAKQPVMRIPVLVATFLGWIGTILKVDARPSVGHPATEGDPS